MQKPSGNPAEIDYFEAGWREWSPACPLTPVATLPSLENFGRVWGWPQTTLFSYRLVALGSQCQRLSDVVTDGPDRGDGLLVIGVKDIDRFFLCVDAETCNVFAYDDTHYNDMFYGGLTFVNSDIDCFARCTVTYHMFRTDPKNLTQSGSTRFVRRLTKALAAVDSRAVELETWWQGILWDIEVGLL